MLPTLWKIQDSVDTKFNPIVIIRKVVEMFLLFSYLPVSVGSICKTSKRGFIAWATGLLVMLNKVGCGDFDTIWIFKASFLIRNKKLYDPRNMEQTLLMLMFTQYILSFWVSNTLKSCPFQTAIRTTSVWRATAASSGWEASRAWTRTGNRTDRTNA